MEHRECVDGPEGMGDAAKGAEEVDGAEYGDGVEHEDGVEGADRGSGGLILHAFLYIPLHKFSFSLKNPSGNRYVREYGII